MREGAGWPYQHVAHLALEKRVTPPVRPSHVVVCCHAVGRFGTQETQCAEVVTGRGTERCLGWGGASVVQVRTARHVRGERDRPPGAEAAIEEEGGGPITAMHHSHMHPSVLREERRPVLQGAAPLALVLPVDILARLLFSGVLPNLVAACERRDAQMGGGWQDAGGGGGRTSLLP